MHTLRDDRPSEHLVVVSGDVGPAEAVELRTALLRALADGDHDVMLDARGMTSFADEALSALTQARLRARSVQHRLVVLDVDGGAMSRSLHRTGRLAQFPLYPEPDAASAALAADRATLAAMDSPLEATWRAVHDHERTQRLEHQAWEHVETASRSTAP